MSLIVLNELLHLFVASNLRCHISSSYLMQLHTLYEYKISANTYQKDPKQSIFWGSGLIVSFKLLEEGPNTISLNSTPRSCTNLHARRIGNTHL